MILLYCFRSVFPAIRIPGKPDPALKLISFILLFGLAHF